MKIEVDGESTIRSAKRTSMHGRSPSEGTQMAMAGNNAKAENAEKTATQARDIARRNSILGSAAVVVVVAGFLALNIAGSEAPSLSLGLSKKYAIGNILHIKK